ncbi:MAG: Maf family protein [Phycisphaerales bacterium]|nr:Maf family protein [Phycisphaerales bacterium]
MNNLIVASQSPRRKQLMEAAGYSFKIVVSNIDETSPESMLGEEVPEYLAHQKALAIAALHPESTILAADTIVLLGNEILGKPIDSADAFAMLQMLSGKVHRVITGVCIWTPKATDLFSVQTEVFFRPLTLDQIHYYITHYKPFDKAGSYAIQEWIGMIGIEKINGDYYNVMGLPIGEVTKRLPK